MHHTHARTNAHPLCPHAKVARTTLLSGSVFTWRLKQLWSGVFFVCGKKYIGVTLLSVVRYFMKCDDQLSTDGNASDVDKGQTGYHHLMPDLGEKVGSYI